MKRSYLPKTGQGIEIASINMTPDGRLTRADAAAYLGVSENTLRSWASRGKGPKYQRLGGKKVFYPIEWLNDFIAEGVAA